MESTVTNIEQKAQKWLDSNIDSETRSQIEALMADQNKDELTESFYKDLEFGTGGLRGIMGVGSNRVNKYTVGMATQGLANYLLKTYPGEEISVCIAHDSRNNSPFFADTTASVFSANGIKVYFFNSLRPTPELSFAIRHFGCKSGVVITASHNPKEYNGYKAYWDDGAQIIAPHDKNIIAEVNNITGIDDVKFDKQEDKIEIIGEEIDKIYLDEIADLSLAKEEIKAQHDLGIVFTPIHGTGITLVPKILEQFGFKNVTVVEEQAEPNGDFPTVVYPNPEEKEAMTIAMEKAKSVDAELVMATDPDSDRVGIAVKNDKDEFQLLNGNQTGSLLIYYLLKKWQESGKLDGNQFVVKTIVTTDLIAKIADYYKVDSYDTLTGFKFIAALIKELEGTKKFIGGGEESYGYLIGDFVRDKDAIASCAMIAEMAAYAKANGNSLYEMLMEMYEQFGLFREELQSITKKGKQGAEEIVEMMRNMRSNPPKSLGGQPLKYLIDYKSGTKQDIENGTSESIDFPSSNVLQFITADGTKVSARPSGTEPKIKFYFGTSTDMASRSDFEAKNDKLAQRLNDIKKELGL